MKEQTVENTIAATDEIFGLLLWTVVVVYDSQLGMYSLVTVYK